VNDFALSDKEKQELLWGNLAHLYQNVDRIISGKYVQVILAMDSPNFAPAWTILDTNSVFLNTKRLGSPRDLDSIIAVTAVNYHELCHVTKTPLVIGKRIPEHHQDAYNLLEDQRIEREFVADYPIAGAYFNRMIAKYILDKKDQLGLFILYVLTHGRDYLPVQLRIDIARRCLAGGMTIKDASIPRGKRNELKIKAQAAQRIIDEYVQLPLTGVSEHSYSKKTVNRAIELIRGMAGLLSDENRAQIGGSTCAVVAAANQLDSNDIPQRKDAKVVEIDAAIVETLTGIVVDGVVELQKDVTKYQKVMSKGVSTEHLLKPPADIAKMSVPVEWMGVTRKNSRRFERICADKDPGWETRTSSGRLNSGRIASGCDPTEAFDSWAEDQTDDTAVELAICMDCSGSMGDTITKASLVMWSLKRSVESVGGHATCFGFHSSSFLLYGNSKAERNRYQLCRANGGTVPIDSLVAAHTLLATSDRPNKILIVVTDGSWCNCHGVDGSGRRKGYYECPATKSNQRIERIGKGATTALFYLNYQRGTISPDSHGCQSARSVLTVSELDSAVNNLVADVMKRGARR
jgi:hypothetical protein